MNSDEFVRKHIKIETESDDMDLNVFLALCKICDLTMVDTVVAAIPNDVKVSTVSCNSCGNQNSVLMFTLHICTNPEDDELYLNNKEE